MEADRLNISSAGKFETIIGYSRAVKKGNLVFVSGTTGTNDKGELVSKESTYEQTVQALRNIQTALSRAGATLQDVVRTRVFMSQKADLKEITHAHQQYFGTILPASSLLVCLFADPDILVEIEADAVLNPEK